MGNKMEVIARKEKSVVALLWFCILVPFIITVIGLFSRPDEWVGWMIFGVAFFGLDVYCCVEYALVPQHVIMLDEDNNLHLPKGVTVALAEVTDVSYECERVKSTTYEWGSVTIKTENAKYKCDYVADCAIVAARLTDMVKRAKSGDTK